MDDPAAVAVLGAGVRLDHGLVLVDTEVAEPEERRERTGGRAVGVWIPGQVGGLGHGPTVAVCEPGVRPGRLPGAAGSA